MDWPFVILVIFTAFVLESESKPLLLNAVNTDDDLLAEESQSFAQASSSAYGGAVAYGNAGSSNFGGYGYGPPPVCHPHPYPHHSHHQPFYPPPSYGPFYPQPNYGNPHFIHPSPYYDMKKLPNFFDTPQNTPGKPLMPNNKNEPTSAPTSNVPITTISTPNPAQPEESSTAMSPTQPVPTPIPIDTESTSSTSEEPAYDIDIRFNQ